jgi:hypothetical protein
MSEYFNPPSFVLVPDYWDGHSTEDDCEWVNGSIGIHNVLPNLRYDRVRARGDKLAKNQLNLYLKTGAATVLRSFTQAGEIFDANNFPAETIVRFEQEVLYGTGLSRIDTYYTRRTCMGMVTEFEDLDHETKKEITAFRIREGGLGLDLLPSAEHYNPLMTIGQVTHDRSLVSGLHAEAIERFTMVELLQYGKPVPERAKQGLRRFIPNLGLPF